MRKIRSAVIGLGQIGLMYDFDKRRESPSSHSVAYQMNPDIEFIAAMDHDLEKSEYLSKLCPGVKFYSDLESMLNENELDLISICTPPHVREELLNLIFRNSSVPKVIFCEKPIVMNIAEAQRLMRMFEQYNTLLIPNLSRRWNSGIQSLRESIREEQFGKCKNIHVRYTRGIFNTGSHIFDLLRFFFGEISDVQSIRRVRTSSDLENELSLSFLFNLDNINGFAEAFDDSHYYLFEMDFYFDDAKIELALSGDEVRIFQPNQHPLFTGYNSLSLTNESKGLLKESNIMNAVSHLVNVINGIEEPICSLRDGLVPLYIGEALIHSYNNQGSTKKVVYPL